MPILCLQTNGAKAPEASLQDALIDIGSEFTSITQQFEAAIQKQQEANGYQPFKESDTHQQGQLMDDMGQHSMGQGDMGYAPANQY